MQAYAACDDPEIRAVVRAGFGDLVAYVERVSDCRRQQIWPLLSPGDALERLRLDGTDRRRADEPWAARLLDGCKDKDPLALFFHQEVSDESQNRTIWTFVITSVALFMVTLDNLVVTTALPVIRRDLHAGIGGLEWTVNAYTLTFAVLLLTGRRARRPLRPPPDVRARARHLHARLRRCGARAVDRRARRRPRGAGPRRRDRDAADADDPLRGRAGRAARPRARRLGRDQRPRGRVRAARRRRRRQRHLLALDLLAERPDRARARAARAAAARRDARPLRPARPPRPRPRQRRPLRDRLGARPRQHASAGARRRSSARSSVGAVLVAAFVAWELPRPAPMLPMRFFRDRTFALANVASLFMSFGMFGSIFLLAQFFQTVQGYYAARSRACASCPGRRCR